MKRQWLPRAGNSNFGDTDPFFYITPPVRTGTERPVSPVEETVSSYNHFDEIDISLDKDYWYKEPEKAKITIRPSGIDLKLFGLTDEQMITVLKALMADEKVSQAAEEFM